MGRIALGIFLTVCSVFCACGEKKAADLVLLGGKVFTMDRARPWAEALALKGNRITAVGSRSEIESYISPGKTQVLKLEGKLILPGFNDAHLHFIEYGASLDGLNLTGITSYGQMKERLAARVKLTPPGEWIKGGGWDHVLVPGMAWPTREIIDSLSPDNPVVLSRIDEHSALVNSYVLRLSGITASTPDPPGGAIVRDPKSGEPTGILKEKARELIREPAPDARSSRQAQLKHLRLALAEARKYGVTSLQPMAGIKGYDSAVEVYEELQRAGELTVRASLGQPLTGDPEKLAAYWTLRDRLKDNPLIRFGVLKGFVDGTIGSQTAALFEPYSDDPSKSGLLMYPEQELEDIVLRADRQGFQIALHAIGDRGNHLALNAFEKAAAVNGPRDSRHRIEHVSLLHQPDIPRFAALGVIASMQPTFCSDLEFTEQRFGLERCRYAFAWRSLLEAGGKLAFGTDCPVEELNPLAGLYAALTRIDRRGHSGRSWFPEEKLTLAQALELYTLGPAYASFEEKIKGSIEPGKLADLVVLSPNLFEIPEEEILEAKVVCTIFDGKVIFQDLAGNDEN